MLERALFLTAAALVASLLACLGCSSLTKPNEITTFAEGNAAPAETQTAPAMVKLPPTPALGQRKGPAPAPAR